MKDYVASLVIFKSIIIQNIYSLNKGLRKENLMIFLENIKYIKK